MPGKKEKCKHDFGGKVYYTNPLRRRCIKCGQWQEKGSLFQSERKRKWHNIG
jgi:hypothetical protein